MEFTDKLHFFASILFEITFLVISLLTEPVMYFYFLQNAMHPETTSYVVQKYV